MKWILPHHILPNKSHKATLCFSKYLCMHASVCVCVCVCTHLLKLKSSRSKTSTGPVLLRMVRGWPANRQNTAPVNAVPKKLSNTPCTEIKRKNKSTKTGTLIRFEPVCAVSSFWKRLIRLTAVSNTNGWSFLR